MLDTALLSVSLRLTLLNLTDFKGARETNAIARSFVEINMHKASKHFRRS